VDEKQLRILVIKENRIKGSVDGIDRMISTMCELDKENEWIVLTNSEGFFSKHLRNIAMVEIIKFPGSGWRSLLKNLSGLLRARKFIQRLRPDVVIETQAYHRIISGVVKKAQIINYHHSSGPNTARRWKQPLAFIYKKFLGTNFDNRKIIVVCRSAKEKLVQMGYPEKNIFLIPNPFPTFEECKESECRTLNDHVTVVGIGRINSRKGARDFAQVAKLITRSNSKIKFKFLGTPKGEEGASIIQSYNRYVEFTGHVENPETYLRNADIGLFLSHEEASSLTIREMMSAGLPVVHWDLPNIVDDLSGQGSLSIPFGNHEMVCEAVLSLEEDVAKRKSLGELNSRKSRSWTQREHLQKFLEYIRN
jgi:glycosyltransferase involved in cell wall biosynthesis